MYLTIKTTDPVHSCRQNVTEQGWTFYQKCFQKHHCWANCLSLYSHFFHLLNCVSKLANWECVQNQLESDSWYLWQLERLRQRAGPEWGITWSFHRYEVGTSNVQLKIFIAISTKSVPLLPSSNLYNGIIRITQGSRSRSSPSSPWWKPWCPASRTSTSS